MQFSLVCTQSIRVPNSIKSKDSLCRCNGFFLSCEQLNAVCLYRHSVPFFRPFKPSVMQEHADCLLRLCRVCGGLYQEECLSNTVVLIMPLT